MVGFTRFPAIRRDPYFLSLSGYGFYWFELRRSGPSAAPQARP
jgi:maltose alpha-D-glucosyltransferase/alpha-amylase